MLKTFITFLLAASVPLWVFGCSSIGGNFRGEPHEMDANISAQAKALIKQAFSPNVQDADNEVHVADHHIHILARGLSAECEAYINPDLNTWRHPYLKLKTLVMMSASGVDDYDNLDQQYADRLLALLKHFQKVQQNKAYAEGMVSSQFYIYALDYHYDEESRNRRLDRTDVYVSNDCVVNLARRFNRELGKDVVRKTMEIIPVASVHPYRRDFKDEISRLQQQGVRFIKWLPPSMNINLSRVDRSHYDVLADAGMTLFVHTGDEHAFRVYDDHQKWGDPVALHHALTRGVKVMALHMAREGEDPETGDPYFMRLMEMMRQDEYRGKLIGEISAVTLGDCFGCPPSSQGMIPMLIDESQSSGLLGGRLYNGSDYPIPAVNYLNPLRELAERKMITHDEKEALNEIYAYNPLLFDFVLKRTIKHPKTNARFLPQVFQPINDAGTLQ